jgi:tetratricopeptide (TPR) repeat protein
VATLDVAPTIAQIVKLPTSESGSFQGESLLGAIDESREARDEAVYAESYYPRDSFGWHELRALVTPRFKYIDAPRAELYDLERDSGERTNIIGDHSAIASSLREQLAGFTRTLTGRDAASPGAPLDPETLEKLKSLGYLSYKAGASGDSTGAERADPKDKITTLNRLLRAADLMHLGKRAEADQLLARLEQDEPELYVIPFERGENELAWGKPQPAVEEFKGALSRNPAFDQAALGLGRAYFVLGDDQRARTAFELALRLNPRNFLARDALAKVYWRANLLDKAEAELEQVVREHPEFPEGHADYGIILAKLRRYRAAASEIEGAIRSGYRDPIAYNYLGIAHAELGNREQALRDYEQAVALDPRYAAAYLNLALQYRNQGQRAKAQTAYTKVCELSDELCRQYAGQFR